MEPGYFTDEKATKEGQNFGIRFRVSYFALFTSIFFSLTWTINVGVTRFIHLKPNHSTPAISDATYNRWQHPYYVLSMTASMCLLSVFTIFVRSLQFFKPKSWRAYLCDFGLASGLFATVCTAISSAIHCETKEHFFFGILGGAGTGVWLILTATFPPCSATKPWMNAMIRSIAGLGSIGGLIGAGSFSINSAQIGAVGEYVSVGGLCIFIAALATKIHVYEVTIQENANKHDYAPKTMENIHMNRREEELDPFIA